MSITFSGKLKCPEHHLLTEIYAQQLASEWQLHATNIDRGLLLLLLLLIKRLKRLKAS